MSRQHTLHAVEGNISTCDTTQRKSLFLVRHVAVFFGNLKFPHIYLLLKSQTQIKTCKEEPKLSISHKLFEVNNQ